MGYMTLFAQCASCERTFVCNPDLVPSLRINGEKQPLCEGCFHRWNKIHRLDKGLEPEQLRRGAYEPEECS